MPILLLEGEGFSHVFMFLEKGYEEHNTKGAYVHTVCTAFSISNLVTMPTSYWLCVDIQEQGNFCPVTSFSLNGVKKTQQFTYVVKSAFHGTEESKVQSQFCISHWCSILHCQLAD
jgi:hypothetical protein